VLRPKGHLSRGELILLGIVALLPFASIGLRVLSLPGVIGPELGPLRAIAVALNQSLSLSAIPAAQRDAVLYLLLLPTCALLVAIARLTFGIRVLGFRSILIAVGFHQSGVIPSLLLIAIAVAAIVLLRPWLKRIRLPYYGRVSVILCVVAMTMVGALLAGPWMRSDVLWSAAYFPVIVLGMLAEGIAHTLDRDNAVAASWRALTTILLAFLIALVCWVPALRGLVLQFPELVVTQIVAIVMVSEFLDLRLLQGWDAKLAARLLPVRARLGPLPVAVVRNRIEDGAAADPGTRAPALRSVQKIVDALKEGGHAVRVLEGDASLPGALRRFFGPAAEDGGPSGIVLNLAHGTRGGAGATHVPALLDLAGIAYTGPGPLGQAVTVDRVAARSLLAQAGLPVPPFWRMARPRSEARGLRYPALVHPRHEPGVKPWIVADRRQLRRAVRRIGRRHAQEAFVEERVTGRHIRVALVGNAPVECLPLVELDAKRRARICPARLDLSLEERVREHAVRAFHACGCRDYARVDVCVTDAGEPLVIDVVTLGILARGGSFALAGAEAGYSFSRLLCRIVEEAQRRHVADEPVRAFHPRPRADAAPPTPAPSPIELAGTAARE
jgi:D-alanine-D-alanine ligase